jgi:membrane-associated phospholipid phosphatase
MSRAIAMTTAAFAAFTALVLSGAMNRIDDWGVDHVMPALAPRAPGNGVVAAVGLWRPFKLDVPWWQQALGAYNYPASVLVSGLVITVAAVALLRRGAVEATVVWVATWCVANGLELVGKHELERPGVHWSNGHIRIHVLPYDSSFPSGHTVRAVVLAATVAYAWPRARFAAAAWLALVPATLVVDADHTISDVVGGLLLGLLLLLLAHAMIRRWTRSPNYSIASNGASSAIRSRFSRTSQAATSSSPTRS